jgi:hypothetical protein
MIIFDQRANIPRRADKRDQRPNIPRKADKRVRDSNPKVQLPPVNQKVTKMLNLALIQIFHPVVMHLYQRPNIPRSAQLETKSAASSSKLKSNKDVESSSDLDFSSSSGALSRSTKWNKKSSTRTDFIYHKAFTAYWEFEN